MTRIIWPATGTARAKAGRAMRAHHPPGSLKKAGSAPEAGSRPRLLENSKIKSTASQNEGMARQTIENMRITWSGQRSL